MVFLWGVIHNISSSDLHCFCPGFGTFRTKITVVDRVHSDREILYGGQESQDRRRRRGRIGSDNLNVQFPPCGYALIYIHWTVAVHGGIHWQQTLFLGNTKDEGPNIHERKTGAGQGAEHECLCRYADADSVVLRYYFFCCLDRQDKGTGDM